MILLPIPLAPAREAVALHDSKISDRLTRLSIENAADDERTRDLFENVQLFDFETYSHETGVEFLRCHRPAGIGSLHDLRQP